MAKKKKMVYSSSIGNTYQGSVRPSAKKKNKKKK